MDAAGAGGDTGEVAEDGVNPGRDACGIGARATAAAVTAAAASVHFTLVPTGCPATSARRFGAARRRDPEAGPRDAAAESARRRDTTVLSVGSKIGWAAWSGPSVPIGTGTARRDV